jgi:homopolymeric O-antigen transport system permease protein
MKNFSVNSSLLKRLKRLFNPLNIRQIIELVRANFKRKDHNSISGIFWSLAVPAVMLGILLVVFRSQYGKEIRYYPLYILTGIVCVNFVATTVSYLLKIFVEHREMIRNSIVYRENILISALITHGYKFIIELLICIIIALVYKSMLVKFLIFLIPLIIAFFILVLGIGMLCSMIYCFARDIGHIWMIFSRILFFVTPIFYDIKDLGKWAKFIVYWLNPITPFVISLRSILMGDSFNMLVYCHALTSGVLFFMLGSFIYYKFEYSAVEQA